MPRPLYKEDEYQASTAWPFGTCLKSGSPTNRHDWINHTRIDENPVKKGTRSLLRQDVPIKTFSQHVQWQARKKRFVMTRSRQNVTLRKAVSRLDLWKYYSLYGCMWNLFCRAGHYPCVQNIPWSIRRRNPPCNVKDKTMRRTHRH